MSTLELRLFTVTDPLTDKRRRTTYRLTLEEARERYVDPEPVPGSLERRQVDERLAGESDAFAGSPFPPPDGLTLLLCHSLERRTRVT
jgi:hypothetical protein